MCDTWEDGYVINMAQVENETFGFWSSLCPGAPYHLATQTTDLVPLQTWNGIYSEETILYNFWRQRSQYLYKNLNQVFRENTKYYTLTYYSILRRYTAKGSKKHAY